MGARAAPGSSAQDTAAVRMSISDSLRDAISIAELTDRTVEAGRFTWCRSSDIGASASRASTGAVDSGFSDTRLVPSQLATRIPEIFDAATWSGKSARWGTEGLLDGTHLCIVPSHSYFIHATE